jgi:ribosomal RNA-processing protein 9
VTGAVVTTDGRHLFTSSKDGSIIQWDLLTGRKGTTFSKQPQVKRKGKNISNDDIKGHSEEIWALSVSDDCKYLASGGKDRRICIWDIRNSSWVKGFRGHKDSISVR